MKKDKKWHIVWVVGIYAILISVLYMVVLYKVNWEDKDLNKYLYFYNCNDNICTSDIAPDSYYNYILCEKKKCPYIKEIKDNLVILSDNNKEYIYDYINDKIINNKYNKYKFTNYNYYIVANESNLEGVINGEGEVVVDFLYDKIIDYHNDFIAYEKDNKYGIDNEVENIYIEPKYDDIILVNSSIFAYKEGDSYYFGSYQTKEQISENVYDYIYARNGVILTSKNNQLDILNGGLKTTLLLKINSYYTYKKEKEREYLNPHFEGNLFIFNVNTSKENQTKYIYDLKTNKLFS